MRLYQLNALIKRIIIIKILTIGVAIPRVTKLSNLFVIGFSIVCVYGETTIAFTFFNDANNPSLNLFHLVPVQ